MKGWIGVDLDGTLAEYSGWQGVEHIGDPIPAMVERVRKWLAAGQDIRIYTARVCVVPNFQSEEEVALCRQHIEAWCAEHLGRVLPVTATKDLAMVECWDDRSVTVERNTGRILGRNI